MAGKPRKQTTTVTAHGFKGMNNLPREAAVMLDRQNRITPEIILNAFVTDNGVLLPREGFSLKDIRGLHSLWSGSVMLGVGVDDKILYRVDASGYTPITTLPGPRSRLQYAEVGNLVYMANKYWRGAYDLLSGQMRPWGVSLPTAPKVAIESGDFSPGTYILCYTRTENGQMSGSGPLVQIAWEGTTKGIRLLNLPENGQCWITQQNGKKLLRAEVEGGVIQGQIPAADPLLSLSMEPPPNFEDFCFMFGRIWGIKNNRLHYSFPGFPEWFRQGDYRMFMQPLVMVAPANGGIYVHSRNSSWFLNGTDPAKMELSRVGEGAIPGTLTFAQLPASLAGGAATPANFATMSQLPTPIWMAPTGFVVGTHTGHLTNLTDHRLRFRPRDQGASLFQVKDGIPHIVTTLYGPPAVGVEDDNLNLIFERGSIF